MSWIQDLFKPKARVWEDMYRNRWQHDRVVRSTHGVNCTGGCSWMVYTKDGIVTWELQATDYPDLGLHLPPHEPRGCQRGITFSWYLYSPQRVKYPYMRGRLLDLWRAAKATHGDSVSAWESIMQDEESRRSFQRARGKGGFRRVSWDETLELIAASLISTIKRYGPDRIISFTPIPAMSMVSYAAGTRFTELLGGIVLSYYDWYSDFPPASPEVWGEKTDVGESADWYNSKYIVVGGNNLNMTRTPDAHYAIEARFNGSKLVVMSPDFSQVSKHADWWIPVTAGQDGAFWMAANHVILNEFFHQREVPYFIDYLKRYSDAPFLVELEKTSQGYQPGRLLRANTLKGYRDVEHGDWKFLVLDRDTGTPRMPLGSIGYRWQKKQGEWNLDMRDGLAGKEINPLLSLLTQEDEILQIQMTDFATGKNFSRGVPVKHVETETGKVAVTTIFDLLMMQFGVSRGLPGDYPADYQDAAIPYTPAWQESQTGVDKNVAIQFAREWAETAERTKGKCTYIVGSGVNHWFNNNLNYRAAITALMLCGCVGVNGGGLNHYTGQEKIAPDAPWSAIAFATDWIKPPRLQNAPSFHYIHTDQWRYEESMMGYHPGPEHGTFSAIHTADHEVNAVRMGWLPFYPSFNRNPFLLAQEAARAEVQGEQDIGRWIVAQLKNKELRFAAEDPDAPENWPRVWLIWRGNALMSSAKGQEYFLKHYLGTHSNTISEERARDTVHELQWREPAPVGKLDLVVDMNFRMDTTALYSDIILPSATWYEKDDMNTTDLHSYIHPLSAAVPPCWESKSDWDIFKTLSKKVSEMAMIHLPKPVRDIVMTPLMHDTPDEIAQPEVRNWIKGECEPIPGKTMSHIKVVERDYVNLYNQYISFGPLARDSGIGMHGFNWPIKDIYEELLKSYPVHTWGGQTYLSLEEAKNVANYILTFAPETNGEMSYRGFKDAERQIGKPLADLVEEYRGTSYDFGKITDQPRRLLTSPGWSGITNRGRAYAPYCINIEWLFPWRTLTGRQHFYMDHRGHLEFGEHLPTFKPKLDPRTAHDLLKSKPLENSVLLNCITPHGKWHIHTTYYDTLHMLTLSRGVEPFWLNVKDAEAIGVSDNDWVEVYNDHGVVVTRAVVSARIPRGVGIFYHLAERTIDFPKSPLRGDKRGGSDNSLTRIRLKPLFLIGGYGQFSYGFNYWGPPAPDRDTYVLIHKLEGEPKF